MSKAAIYKAIQTIANELLVLAHTTLETDRVGTNPKSGSNTLSDSQLNKDLLTVWKAVLSGRNDVVVTALFNNYVQYLDWQRPKKYGKKPPIDTLKDWAVQNGIPTDADTLWAISTAIWRDGHSRRPIFGTLNEYCNKTFESDWADRLFEALTDELDNFFNS
jgi:hypothetical protein